MKADEHVAITGANGLGKSTLLNALMPDVNVPAERLLYMPQKSPPNRAESFFAI